MNIKGETEGLDLDSLTDTLRNALSGANRTLLADQESALRRIIDVGEDGEPEYITWLCSVASRDGQDQNYEMLRMPISALRSGDVIGISELSVELDCVTEHPRQEEEKGLAEPSRLIPLLTGKKRRGAAVRHVKIALKGPDGAEGSIRIEEDYPKPGILSVSEGDEGQNRVGEEQYGFFKGQLLPYFCHLYHVVISFLRRLMRCRDRPLRP